MDLEGIALMLLLILATYTSLATRKLSRAVKANAADLRRFNELLRIVNSIAKLIVREKRKEKLLEAIAKEIVMFYDYKSSIIVDSNLNIIASVNAELKHVEHFSKAIKSKNVEICHVARDFLVAVPITYGEKVYGVLALTSIRHPDCEEVQLLEALASDIAFALEHIELEEEKKRIYDQINKNIEQLARVVDRIRNPVAIIAGLAETKIESREVVEEILEQVRRIDELCNEIESCWVKSEELVERFLTSRSMAHS